MVTGPRFILKGTEARERLLLGIQILARSVAVTYGPKGRTAILDRMAGLLATKDGVTVAREVKLTDPVVNMGCQLLKEACIQVNDEAGDGTTTAAILAAAILEEGHKAVASGLDPNQIARGIEDASKVAAQVIGDMASSVETMDILERVAMIASNGDVPVSKALAEACMAVGRDGTVAIEDGNSVGIDLIYKDGMEIDRGVASRAFLEYETERVIEGPLVAVIGTSLTTIEDIKSVMEVASQWPQNQLLVIAEDIRGDALKTMVMNNQQDVMPCCAILAPGFHHHKKAYLRDIAALSGGDYIDSEMGLNHQEWNAEWFGSLRKITTQANKSTFIAYDEASEVIETRLREIDVEMSTLTSEFDKDRCKERKAKLSGGLCIMQVGGVTELEMKERRARIEDALGAVQASLEWGVVPGGGIVYIEAHDGLLAMEPDDETPEFKVGWRAMTKALTRPLYHLAENAGKEGAVICYQVSQARKGDSFGWIGWDVLTGKIRDLGDAPVIIDPTQVAVKVVETAASIAMTLLKVEASVTRLP